MNIMFLTGLSVALTLSIITSNNFYANKTTNTSINHFHNQASYYAKISNHLNNINNINNNPFFK